MILKSYMRLLFIGFVILMFSVVLLPYRGQAADLKPVTRLSGSDRYQTAVEISKTGWKSSDYVVLTVGDGDDKFADALAGSPLSFVHNAPTLLTPSGQLDTYTSSEIKRLGAKNVFILGGTGAISSDVEKQLKGLNLNVERLWGADRYETAVKIGEKVRAAKSSSKVFITTGEEFQYAMMIAPFASKSLAPILFSQKGILSNPTGDALKQWGIKEVEIIGNTSVISQSVEDSIRNMGIKVSRIGGADIDETNINVINTYGKGCNFLSAARKDIFADGLAGASLAALLNMPVLLLDQREISPRTADFLNKYNYNSAYVLGGKGAISDDIFFILEKRVPNVFIYGNTAGNITLGAYTAVKGDWIYYLNDKDDKKLYRIKSDGTGKIKLSDDKPLDINIIGNFIYYENMSEGNKIYKIKTDGTERTKLNDDESWDMNVVNYTIYYSVNTDNGSIYKMSADGTGRTKLNSARSECLNVIGDWIYYTNWDDNRRIYKVKTDGTGTAKVSNDEAWYSNAVGDWIYYSNSSDGNKLYKIRLDGSARTEICDDEAQWINVSGDWIYYSNGSDINKLYKIKTDGTGKAKVFDGTACVINIAGDWIYFSNDLEGLMLFKIKTDGNDFSQVE